jgi:hypothetical protein
MLEINTTQRTQAENIFSDVSLVLEKIEHAKKDFD